MDKPAGINIGKGRGKGRGRWHDLILAATALLYRLSWPTIDAAATATHRAPYSLTTKFLFAFIGLSCGVRVIRAALTAPARARARAGPSRAGAADRLLRCSADVLCLLVVSLNALAGWRAARGAVDWYFTRGLGGCERSRFHRGAAVGCEVVLGAGVVVLMGWCWVSVGGEWWAVVREWFGGHGEEEMVVGEEEEEEKEGGKGWVEKLGLVGDVEGMSGFGGTVSDRKS